MEEKNQNLEPTSEQPKKPFVTPIFIGFTIYDFVHLFCSTVLLVMAYVRREHDWVLEASKSSAEIAFSLLLMAFIISMAKKSRDPNVIDKSYAFSWLTASAGMALSSSFMIPYVLTESEARGNFDLEISCFGIYVICSLAAFFILLVGSFLKERSKARNAHFAVALGLLLVAIVLSIIGECFFGHDIPGRILAISVAAAPIFLVIFGLVTIVKRSKASKNPRE